jgi:hypothetical protein
VLAVILAAAAALATPAEPKVVSPLEVIAPPKGAPPAAVTLQVGGDLDHVGAQDVFIWPAGQRERGTNAYVTLACDVDVHGLAEACRVIFESPPGKGFGAAALALRPLFKLKPREGPEGPEAATLNIAIAFRAGEMHSNLSEIQTASMNGVAPEGSMDPTQNVGHHEINGRNLVLSQIPLEMRRLTMLTDPQWVAAPGFEDLAAAYPAEGGGAEGYAVAHCRVTPVGVLTRCVVAKELPVKHGFGKAAVALTAKFRVSPEAMAAAPHGAPVEVDVPVRFPPPSEAADHVVRNPVWIPGSDPQTLIAALPPGLGRPNSPGAQVGCRVGADGALTGCAIELTSPDGFDFDQAAVQLAGRLRMSLWSGDAGPVEGGIVHLPVRLGVAQQAQR